jgi:hypothetical protein
MLRARLERVHRVSRHHGCGVALPALGRALQSHAPGREWQADLDRMVSVKASRLAGQTNPQAAAAPKQNASGCG